MFTGIIQTIGRVSSATSSPGGMRLCVTSDWFAQSPPQLGASIAVNGVCLTVIDDVPSAAQRIFDVSRETLDKTTLGAIGEGDSVNLEAALTPSTPLGGHIVSGHVDGLGEFEGFEAAGEFKTARFSIDTTLGRFVASKGSIAINGVSLTTNAVYDEGARTRFEIALVPHTLSATTLGELAPGDAVNVEVDQLARYVARLTEGTLSDG